MGQILGIVGVLLCAAFIIAIPITILTIFKRRAKRAFAELAVWAQGRGLVPGRASAVPRSLAGSVAALHYAMDGGVLSINVAESKQQAHVTFYYRPATTPPGGGFTLGRRSWGAAGKPATGDAKFDEHFLISAQDDGAWRPLLRPEVREWLVQHSHEVWSLSQYDGSLIYMQAGELVDPAARDRALQLLRLLVGAGPG